MLARMTYCQKYKLDVSIWSPTAWTKKNVRNPVEQN